MYFTKNSQDFGSAKILGPILITFFGIFLNFKFQARYENSQDSIINSSKVHRNPKYWGVCVTNWNENGNLRTMNRVFDRIGFESVNASNGDDWDVFWSIEYPFDERQELFELLRVKPLKPHQRLNHFAGLCPFVCKDELTTKNRDLNFILPSFVLPDMRDEMENFIKQNPQKKIVTKNFCNRGVEIVNVEDLDLNIYDENNDGFFQEFMDDPMLIDGNAFDLGIFVLISSVNPLRVYRYETEVLLRFCPEPYHPFNATNIDKFVIYETHKHYDQMPSFQPYVQKLGFPSKKAFEEILTHNGYDVSSLWESIDEAIEIILMRSEQSLIKETIEHLNSTHHSFELVRFDFLIDSKMKLHLMEVNMSPNLTPAEKRFERNANFYEQLVSNTLKLVGAGSSFDLFSMYDASHESTLSNSMNIAVNAKICSEQNCVENCDSQCSLCLPCLTDDDLQNLHKAHREHINRGGFKRIFPNKYYFDSDLTANLSPSNKISVQWFQEKCRENKEWC